MEKTFYMCELRGFEAKASETLHGGKWRIDMNMSTWTPQVCKIMAQKPLKVAKTVSMFKLFWGPGMQNHLRATRLKLEPHDKDATEALGLKVGRIIY